MLIGKNLALMVSPLVPATYLAIGLTGTELKDHMKFSIPPYYIISLIMLVFGVILALLPSKRYMTNENPVLQYGSCTAERDFCYNERKMTQE